MHQAIQDARDEALAHAEADPTYAELMSVYAQLGEALLAGAGPVECGEWASRLVVLGRLCDVESDARWAAWYARQGR